MNPNLRRVRLIRWVLLASVLILAGIAEIGRGAGKDDWTLWHGFVIGLVLLAGYAGFRLRHRLLRRSAETLAKDAASPKGLREWELGSVIGLATAEAVAGWGLVVRMVLAGSRWQASLFYGTSLALFLLGRPRLPDRAGRN